ncbi:MAG: Gfo/Idh/MocA family oxidoreductase [Parvularculaceae bacterium]
MTLNFGIAGTGKMAAAMLPAIRLAGAEAFAVSSHDIERARAFAAAQGIARSFGSLAEMLREPAFDAVYIAGATGAHARDAIIALEAGKHVLCEKPFAMNADEGARVIGAAKASGKLFMEGLWTHFLPAYQRMHALMQERGVGAPKHLAAAYGYPATKALRPRLFDKTDGGVILDLGVYPVSLSLRLLGSVKSVDAQVARNEDGVDTHLAVQLVHDSGAVSQLGASFDALMSNAATLSCASGSITMPPPLFGAEAVIVEQFSPAAPGPAASGLKAALKKNPLLRKLKRAMGGGEHHPYGADQYLPQMLHFIGLIAAGKTESDVASHALSLDTLRVLDRIREGR